MRASIAVALLLASASAPAVAQSNVAALRAELDQARAEIAAQRTALAKQEERLKLLEARMNAAPPAAAVGVPPRAVASAPQSGVNAAQGSASTVVGDVAAAQQAPIETVGAAPADYDRAPEVAVLGDQGSVITRAGQLSGEMQYEYARADRNRAIFRGIEILDTLLIGAFDINESRQDVLTAAGTLRYGVTDRLEVGVRAPFVYRNDVSILTPIAGSTTDQAAATVDNSSKGKGIGDIELSARYQITRARAGRPFLIANLQGVIPTGTDPFGVPRDSTGLAQKAATGSGFYGVSTSVTAILPSDPVVLFGTLGYTLNLGNKVNTFISPVQIDYVDPGDAISASAGIGISFNQRTTLNLGYAHSWAMGTLTRTRAFDRRTNTYGPEVSTTSRDLQIGRFLFGVTYRVNDRASLNWSVEVGATDDATDLRTVLRIPFVLLTGGK